MIAEKARHPRFHIGESLLPLNMPLFEQLGVAEKVRAIAVFKYGAELNSPHHEKPVTLDFDQAWDKNFSYAYQVRRSEFDQILFDNCVEHGALGLQQCRVSNVDFPDGADAEISVVREDGSAQLWQTRYVVDASGRDTFLSNKLGIKRRNPKHASAALYGHFTGAHRLPGRAEGNISLFWFEHGWFWFIPLRDGTTSVGAVCWPYYMKSRNNNPSEFLLDTIALCPPLQERLRNAQLTEPATATGNYSYTSEKMLGDRYILLGDAFAFVDPVFSSGVYLAMHSAFLGAEVVEHSLQASAQAAMSRRKFERSVRHGLRSFSWFIYRMTSPAMRKLFMGPRNHLRMQEALLSLLAGDLFRGTPIYRSLAFFKAVYFLACAAEPFRSLSAWRRRRAMMHADGTNEGAA